MDLGIAGRHAIVAASSRGLGRACAEALANEGVHLVINGRDPASLNIAAAEISRDSGVSVVVVAGDIAAETTRTALLEACPNPDIVVTNAGGPRPGGLRQLNVEDWVEAFHNNMLTHIELIRQVIDGMCDRQFGRIVNITSAMVTTPRPSMALSSGVRTGLVAVMKGLALEVAQHNVTINNLLPERFDTQRQIDMAELAMQRDGVSWEQARTSQVESIAAKRLGRPSEFGAACAFLCGAQSGYISGQNLHLDGGSYPALI
jgi:3-oxoacyl-[acyl-carrier protein] reductase